MQLNIDKKDVMGGILIILIAASLGWAWKLEGRLSKLESQDSLLQRVTTLENSLMPVLIEFKMREELKRRGVDPSILNKEDEAVIPLKKVSSVPATSKPLAVAKVDKVTNGFAGLSYANAKQFMPSPASIIGIDVENAKSLSELKMAVQNDVQKIIKGEK